MLASLKTIAGALVIVTLGVGSYTPSDPELAQGATHPVLQSLSLPPLITRQELLGPPTDVYAWRVSADGTRLASVRRDGKGALLTLERLETGEVSQKRLSFQPDDIGWSPNGRWVFFAVDQDGNESYRLYVLALDALDKEPVDLVTEPNISVELEQYEAGSSDVILISHNRRLASVLDVYQLDLSTGEEVMVAENPGDVLEWHAGRGTGLYARTRRAASGGLILERLTGDEWGAVADVAVEETLEIVGNRLEDNTVLALSNRGRDKTSLVRFSIVDGTEELIYADPDVDVEWVWRTSSDNRPLVAHSYPEQVRHHYFDDTLGARIDALTDGDPRVVASIQDMDATGEKLLVAVHQNGRHAATWLLDRKNDTQRLLFDNAPHPTDKPVARTEPFSFEARDGLTIHGYITRPPGSENAALPAIVWVHGGPFARSYLGFDPMVQLFANRGYVVIDVNFRGSTGYGKSFVAAAQGEFSRKMHTDLIDAVNWAEAGGLIDPDRVAIGGASYGGWAAMVGLAESPDQFVAGISVNGPSDLPSLVAWLSPMPNIWTKFAGDPSDQSQNFDMRDRSPLHNAEKINDPLLVIHSINDNRVPVNHGQRIVKRLQALDRPVEALWVPGEGHSFADENHYVIAAERIEVFLAAHLGGRVSRH